MNTSACGAFAEGRVGSDLGPEHQPALAYPMYLASI